MVRQTNPQQLPEPSAVLELFDYENARAAYAWSIAGRVATGLVITLAVLCWLMSGFAVIRSFEVGYYTRLGANPEIVPPGLHVGVPFPFSSLRRVPVHEQFVASVGFRGTWPNIAQNGLYWTKPHGADEYPLLCGTTTEVVVVNVMLTYKIKATSEGIRSYCTQAAAPETVLISLAEQLLNRRCNRASADSLIAADLVELAATCRDELQSVADAQELGLEVVDFGVLSVHPPPEAAASYLDVLSAKIDARRQVDNATLTARNELTRVAMMSESLIADAKAAAEQRLTTAHVNHTMIEGYAQTYARHPEGLRERLSCRTLAEVLQQQDLVLLDADLPRTTQLLMDAAPSPASK